jgi:hypothetical protein
LIAQRERELLEKGGFGAEMIKQEDTCNLLNVIEEEESKEERNAKFGLAQV